MRSESCYEISFCETHEKRFSLRNFSPRNSREASLATNFDSRVSRESRKNFGSKKCVSILARILKSDSRVNPNTYQTSLYRDMWYTGYVDTRWDVDLLASKILRKIYNGNSDCEKNYVQMQYMNVVFAHMRG